MKPSVPSQLGNEEVVTLFLLPAPVQALAIFAVEVVNTSLPNRILQQRGMVQLITIQYFNLYPIKRPRLATLRWVQLLQLLIKVNKCTSSTWALTTTTSRNQQQSSMDRLVTQVQVATVMVEHLSPNKDNNSPTLDPPFNQIKIKLADHFRTGIEFSNKVWSTITQVSRLRGTPTQASVVAHKIRKPTIT